MGKVTDQIWRRYASNFRSKNGKKWWNTRKNARYCLLKSLCILKMHFGRSYGSCPLLVIVGREISYAAHASHVRERCTPEGAGAKERLNFLSASCRGVLEYWIVDWRSQQVAVYQREQLALRLVATLHPTDTLTSPLLPGFVCQVATLF